MSYCHHTLPIWLESLERRASFRSTSSFLESYASLLMRLSLPILLTIMVMIIITIESVASEFHSAVLTFLGYVSDHHGRWCLVVHISIITSFIPSILHVCRYIYIYLSCTMSHECFIETVCNNVIATFFMFSAYLRSHCLAIEKVDVELPRKHLPGSITHQHMTAKTQMLGPHCVGDSHLKLPQLGKNTQVFKLKCQLSDSASMTTNQTFFQGLGNCASMSRALELAKTPHGAQSNEIQRAKKK